MNVAFDIQYDKILSAIRGTADTHEQDSSRYTAAASETLLVTWKATISETVDCLREIGEHDDVDPDALLDMVSAVAGVLAIPFGYAAAPLSGAGSAQRDSDLEPGGDMVRTLLLGQPPMADLLHQAATYGIDASQDYLAFRTRPCPGWRRDELVEELRAVIGPHRLTDGLLVRLDGDLVGFLVCPPPDLRTCVLGLGPPRTPDRLAESFRLASRAADTAHAFGLAGVHSFDTLGLLPAILADTDVGESLQRRYLRPVAELGAQPEMLSTIRAYFACDMDVPRTAKALLVHPNTLRCRLRDFEELTGARLRDPASAMEVWWALQHASVNAGKPS